MKKLISLIIFLLFIAVGFYFFKDKPLDLKKLPELLKNEKNLLINKENKYKEEKREEKSLQDIQTISQSLNLEIIQPQNNIKINNQNLKIKGKTNPNIEVFVNEKELKSNEKGEFEKDLILDEGENVITIIASDDQGNYAEKEVIVNFEVFN